MSVKVDIQPSTEHELVLCRIMDVPRASLFRAYKDPNLLKQWFVPKPWTISKVENDFRPGGSSLIVMRSPEGQDYPNAGIYLEIVENEKIVTTDAYTSAWVPSEKPFFTAIITFEDAGPGKTKYTARALHWRKEDREAHEQMGFEQGWGTVADQLEEFAKKL